MPKNALLKTLVTLARSHAKARGLSRRALLRGSGAAALLAMPRVARADTKTPSPRIAIVGGGISGLTAALTAKDLELSDNLTVYEASNRIGGRMFSNSASINGTSYWDSNQVSEWCGELIDSDHETIATLAERFGLTMDDLPTTAPANSAPVYLFDSQYYTMAEVEADFAPVYDVVIADATAAIPEKKADGSANDDETVLWNATTPEAIALDNMSIHDWIANKVPGGHSSKLGRLLDLAYASEYGADTKEQSSLNLVLLLSGLEAPSPFAAFGASDERFHIRGGNQQLPLAIANHLRNYLGVSTIKMNHRLTKLVKNADGTTTLTFSVTDAGKTTDLEVVADAVILTLPFAVLADAVDFSKAGFDDRKTKAIKEMGRGLCSKLQLQFTKRLWNESGAWGISNGEESFSDNGDQCSWDVTRGQPGRSGILNGYSGGTLTKTRATTAPVAFGKVNAGDAGAGIATLADGLLTQLDQIYPGLKPLYNGKATLSIPHLDDNFKLSYSFWAVGQYQAFAGYERVPQGNIFFAGEHTSVNYQGFMEGGAAEGLRAMQEVADAAKAGTLPKNNAGAGCSTVEAPQGGTNWTVPSVAATVAVGSLLLRNRRVGETQES